MFKKLSKKKGFTLMEMMIVVAIIASLVAIIIPTFTSVLARAHAATDEANLRAYYAEQMANSVLNNSKPDDITGNKFKVGGVEYTLYGSVATTVTGGQLTISYTGPTGSDVGTITIPGGGNTGATKGG